jgi:cyanophycinase
MRVLSFIAYLLIFTSSHLTFAAPGVVVLAGGGTEGDIGVNTDWSYSLYKKLVENGDTTGDKKIKVVVISMSAPPNNFMVDYFKALGATSSYGLVVKSKKEANDPKVTEMLKDADVVFFRGGDQGKAYRMWKGSKVQEEIQKLSDRGGAIGGTSAGAMALSEFSLTGGTDFGSKEVLGNGYSPFLNDLKNRKKSGINNDFFNAVPGVLVDTHCGERGRIGRLMAVMAKTTDDFNDNKISGICIEEKTGIVISNGKAQVFGTGAVHFLSEIPETKKARIPGKPLSYVNVRSDSLTEGWSYNISTNLPDLDSAPQNTKSINPHIECADIPSQLTVRGKKERGVTFSKPPQTKGLTVAVDAYSDVIIMSQDQKNGAIQTMAFNKLAKDPGGSIVMLDSASELRGVGDNNLTVASQKGSDTIPSLIMDCQYCTHTSKSKSVSIIDLNGKPVHSSSFINLRLHIIGPGDTFNVQTHKATVANDPKNEITDPKVCAIDSMLQKDLDQFVLDQKNLIRKMNCL